MGEKHNILGGGGSNSSDFINCRSTQCWAYKVDLLDEKSKSLLFSKGDRKAMVINVWGINTHMCPK